MQKRVKSMQAPETIVEDLLRRKGKKIRKRPIVVAVAGGSGDGKGYLIGLIQERLMRADPANSMSVLHLDHYYVGREEMRRRGHDGDFDRPESVDHALAAEDVKGSRVGVPRTIPRYDFPSGERVGTQSFTPGEFLFVDGLFSLYYPALLELADYKIFVEADLDSSMLRRLFRDAGPSGRTRQTSREVLEMFFTKVAPAKRTFIEPTAVRADLIVESSFDPEREAHRAGPVQYQLKVRVPGMTDLQIARATGASAVATSVEQVDRYFTPKGRAHGEELLRLRLERGRGDDVFMTYKGPFLPSTAGARPATSPIALPSKAMTWFGDAYDIVATLKKTRTVHQIGDVQLTLDDVKHLGTFVEARADAEASLPQMRALLARIAPDVAPLPESYLALWKRSRSPA